MDDYIDIHSHNIPKIATTTIVNYRLGVDALNFISEKYYSVGLHPWDINNCDITVLATQLKKLCQLPNVLAIGEIGLDKTIDIPLNAQIEVFKKQIEIAEELQKPIIIHCVKAYNELIEQLKSSNTQWIFHGFNKNYQIATDIINNGGIVSFGSAIITNKKQQEVLMQIPINRFFLETDESKVLIEDIYEAVALLLQIDIKELKHIQKELFNKVFSK